MATANKLHILWKSWLDHSGCQKSCAKQLCLGYLLCMKESDSAMRILCLLATFAFCQYITCVNHFVLKKHSSLGLSHSDRYILYVESSLTPILRLRSLTSFGMIEVSPCTRICFFWDLTSLLGHCVE